jgi:hypothetical protein
MAAATPKRCWNFSHVSLPAVVPGRSLGVAAIEPLCRVSQLSSETDKALPLYAPEP